MDTNKIWNYEKEDNYFPRCRFKVLQRQGMLRHFWLLNFADTHYEQQLHFFKSTNVKTHYISTLHYFLNAI